MTPLKRAALALVIGVTTIGSDCINDPFLISLNLQELEVTVTIPAGTTTTFNGSRVVAAAEYLDSGFGSLQNVRVYDITVQGIGTYTGTVTGTAAVNGTTILSYTGPWSQFATAQSLLSATGLTLNAAGVTALRNAVAAQQNVTVAGSGTVSASPVPALQLVIRIYGQIDAEP